MPVLPDVISLESASLESSNVLASDTAFTSDATPSSESCTTIDSFCEDETVVSLPLPISSHHVTPASKKRYVARRSRHMFHLQKIRVRVRPSRSTPQYINSASLRQGPNDQCSPAVPKTV